jgi:hypothetical protein
LDQPFSHAEVESTVKQLPTEKAPGPHGFTAAFYKHCSDVMKHDVMQAFDSLYILHCGALEHVETAEIVLIPKTELATHTEDFWLI